MSGRGERCVLRTGNMNGVNGVNGVNVMVSQDASGPVMVSRCYVFDHDSSLLDPAP